MLTTTLRALFLLPVALRVAVAQTACNNSPSLCDQRYNNITQLGAHDSPFLRDGSTSWSTSGNQFYNSTVQLQAGVRLLTAQVHRTNTTSSGQWHLCHTSCDLLDAGKLSDWLGEVKLFLDNNANEVVTILLVNSDNAGASDLAGEYEEAGIDSYAYVPSTKSASNEWPTLNGAISNGTRLMNFVASLDDNSAAPYLMDEFTYIFENNYENSALTNFSCAANRPSSVSGETSEAVNSGMMPLMNHFLYENQAFGIQTPNVGNLTTTNSDNNQTGSLGQSARECESTYGRRPSFLLVDFFNVGPAIATVDQMNGVTDATGRASVPNQVLSETSAAGLVPKIGPWTLGVVAISVGYALCI